MWSNICTASPESDQGGKGDDEMDEPTTGVTEMTDILGSDGRIVHVSEAEAAALGIAPGAAVGRPWSLLYPLAARERIDGLFASTEPGPWVIPLALRRADGTALATTAVISRCEDAGGTCLRLVKWPEGGALDEVARLAEAKQILSSILATSDDAAWCMEWAEPVDLSAPEQEIVRQVFENGPRWRFCNDAMARLYRTPEGEDFNLRPVRETFPRSPENEDFVRRLIRASFDVNASPSRDLRYDGIYIEVENDVRGHIRGNRLYRMWGTVRDVSKHARRAAVLRDEIEALEAILGALPDAVLMIDREGHLLRANLAAEELLSLPPDLLSERSLGDLVELPMPLSELFDLAGRRMPGQPSVLMTVGLLNANRTARAELSARLLTLRGNDHLVLSLRLRLSTADSGKGRAATARFRARG